MTAQIQLALLGALPAMLAMAYVDRLDAKRPEPRRTLRLVALAGALSAGPVILIGQLLRAYGPAGIDVGISNYTAALYMSFVVAAMPEELAKLLCMRIAWKRPEFDERMDGIVYGARAGLGFALLENIVYLMLIPDSFSEYIAIFVGRAVLAVPGHATWGALVGYFAARRRFDGRGPGLWGGYALAVALHGSYDALLFCTPVAIARGHRWLSLGLYGVPIVAYAVPTVVIVVGAWAVRGLARSAVARDDLAAAQDEGARTRPS